MIHTIMYHYIRNNENYSYDCFGRRFDEFVSQIEFISRRGSILNPKDSESINFYLNSSDCDAYLLTFDDGYLDHKTCAQFLHSLNFSGIFFPPTLIAKRKCLDVNAIHRLLGTRSICLEELLEYILHSINDKCALLSINGENISLESYLTHSHDSRFDEPKVMMIKRLLQRDINESSIRSSIIKSCLSKFCNITSSELSSDLYLTINDMIELKRLGMHFGGHGVNHVWLNTLSTIEQNFEIDGSINFLKSKDLLKSSDIQYFAYPYGSYDNNTLQICQELSIDYAFTTSVGPSSTMAKNINDNLLLKRWDTNDFWDRKWSRPTMPS